MLFVERKCMSWNIGDRCTYDHNGRGYRRYEIIWISETNRLCNLRDIETEDILNLISLSALAN